MKSYMGTHLHSLDSKGRLTMPSRFRELTPDGGVLAQGIEKCLDFYPPEEWDARAGRVGDTDVLTVAGRNARRQLFATAEDCGFDKQGRLVIPAGLRAAVGIEKDVAVVGAGDRIEIWSIEEWERQKSLLDEQAADFMAEAGSRSVPST
jgi:MraZ protein